MIKGNKGDEIGKNVTICLTECGLDRVMIVTVDNTTAIDTGLSYLRRQLSQTSIASGKYLHTRCATHIVNLNVQDGLKEVDLLVKCVRAAVRYIRNGGSRIVKFKGLVEEEKLAKKPFLKLDVPARWNSMYIMLKSAIVYEKVFTKFADEDMSYVIDQSEARDGLGHPDEIDWQNAKKMADFLEHFYELSVRVSANLKITSPIFFHEIGEAHLLIKSWINSTDELQPAMGQRMKDKFNKYWGLWHTNSGNVNENDKVKGRGNSLPRTRRKATVHRLWACRVGGLS